MEPIDVLVVGAGPTGLTMACELIRHGLRVRVIDRAESASVHSKALVVHARTLEVFEAMGLREAVAAASEPMVRLRLIHDRKELGGIAFAELEGTPQPRMLDQSTTEGLLAGLLERLGGRVERERELVRFREVDGRVEATVQGPAGEETIAARWLVGADGAHSAVRHGLGLPFEGAAYEDMFDQADLKVRWDRPPGDAIGILRDEGPVVMLPLPRGRYRIFTIGSSASDPEPTLERFQRLIDELLPGTELYEPDWIIRFKLHRRMSPRLSVGRAFLVGDAAHIHSPAGGQGMNTGIQDAFNLAWKLALAARGAAGAALLDSYHAERHPIAARTLALTDRLFRGAITHDPKVLWFRRTMVPLVTRVKALQRRMALTVSQTRITYREAPSVLDARRWPRRGPRAGDRVPPATICVGGRTTSLYPWLARSAKLTLLLMHGATKDAALTGVGAEVAARWGSAIEVVDRVREGDAGLHAAWHVRGPELVLVRPDGHVAVRAPVGEAAALRAWAERWLDVSGG